MDFLNYTSGKSWSQKVKKDSVHFLNTLRVRTHTSLISVLLLQDYPISSE
jgi:hypothetical protein